jgi:serine-threonine kinase receptor-associated protein
MFLSVADLSVVHSIEMPAPMHFREEGGASLSPNGTKILAVSTGSDLFGLLSDLIGVIQGGSDLWLREFDAISGNLIQTFKGHHGPIRCVRYARCSIWCVII